MYLAIGYRKEEHKKFQGIINNNKQSLEAMLDVSFLREAFICQSGLLQFFSWLNCWEKKGHGSFNERFVLL